LFLVLRSAPYCSSSATVSQVAPNATWCSRCTGGIAVSRGRGSGGGERTRTETKRN